MVKRSKFKTYYKSTLDNEFYKQQCLNDIIEKEKNFLNKIGKKNHGKITFPSLRVFSVKLVLKRNKFTL